MHVYACLTGKKESIHRPAPVQNSSLQRKNGVHRGKISVVDMVFLVFTGFCIHHRPGKFFLETRKVPQRIFFRWWLCTLFSSLSLFFFLFSPLQSGKKQEKRAQTETFGSGYLLVGWGSST